MDLLAVAEQMQRGDLRCVECGVNVVVLDPFEDRLRLMDCTMHRNTATGEVYARCTAHGGSSAC